MTSYYAKFIQSKSQPTQKKSGKSQLRQKHLEKIRLVFLRVKIIISQIVITNFVDIQFKELFKNIFENLYLKKKKTYEGVHGW